MQIKYVCPISFLVFRTETKINELYQFIPVGQELFREAMNIGVNIMGPIHWHYVGFTGDESKTFTLEISLPVGAIPGEYDGKFHFKRTETFKCVSATHEGGWLDIPKTYAEIFKFMASEGLKPVGINREVYVNSDLQDPAANTTIIQVGVE